MLLLRSDLKPAQNLSRQELRLLPGRKVHSSRDGHAFGIEKPEFAKILPVETGTRKRRVCQPGDRDVVEDVVAGEALGFSRNTRAISS